MSTVAVIGAEAQIRGFALAGAVVLPADDPGQVRSAWQALPADVAVVLLTVSAAAALPEPVRQGLTPLVAVMT
ncbi:MAG TPA: V-type ATP synthase subunit F [Micromonosporaceae bacterium]